MTQTAPEVSQIADYGLRREILSPMETLAQSVSTMAPTTTPAATIPLVCALAGNGTWLAYVLATVGGVACRSLHQPLRSPFRLARLALHLRFDDSASVAWRHRRMESFAGLCGHGIERHRRLLPLRQLAAARRHGPRLLGSIAGHRWSPGFRYGLLIAT